MIDYLFHMPKKCHSGDLFGADNLEILERGYTSNEVSFLIRKKIKVIFFKHKGFLKNFKSLVSLVKAFF